MYVVNTQTLLKHRILIFFYCKSINETEIRNSDLSAYNPTNDSISHQIYPSTKTPTLNMFCYKNTQQFDQRQAASCDRIHWLHQTQLQRSICNI